MPTLPTIALHGDDDDHLRAVVLLSTHLDRSEQDAFARCRAPRENPWARRLDAFKELIRGTARRARGPVACVEDPDALDDRPMRDHTRWDDAHFDAQRRELLDVLIDGALERGVFVLRRTRRDHGVDRRLRMRPISRDRQDAVQGPALSDSADLPTIPSHLAPIARWLVRQGAMSEIDLEDTYARFNVLPFAWEALKPSARDAAMRLCAERTPMHANGTMGPFDWGEAMGIGAQDSATVPRAAVDQLIEAGFLQPSASRPTDCQMPRGIRHFVLRHARARHPDRLQSIHRTLAHTSSGTDDVDAWLTEAHWHAIAGDDEEMAFATSTYYGSDLRALAIQLGRGAHRVRRLEGPAAAVPAFARAASIFERIVADFDPEDAYAWEYAAYNRWQFLRAAPSEVPAKTRAWILRGFEVACELDVHNPLFRGRLLAFRAACGEPIDVELVHWTDEFRHAFRGSPRALVPHLTWFVEPIRTALLAHRGAQAWERWCVHRPIVIQVEAVIRRRRQSDPLSEEPEE